MKLDFATLAFGYSVKTGGATPNWATALGQGKEHKINDNPEISELLKGMMHSAVSLEKVSTKIGKGGNVVLGNVADSPIVLASVFQKVYINDVLIPDGQFVLMITKDTSKSHAGRLRLKYGPSNTYMDNGQAYSNQIFFKQARKNLGLADDACWFVSDISVINQDTLVLKAVIVDEVKNTEYENTADLHSAWEKLEPSIAPVIASFGFDKARNRIVFGAPGTGKSFALNQDKDELLGADSSDYERVTFHPSYSYANFVGSYKPVMVEAIEVDFGKKERANEIAYEYVPGPFMRILVKALKSAKTYNPKPYLLIIEEINRANVAAVFGEVFQLLDRDENGESEYSINATEDIKKYLAKPENLGGQPDDYNEIKIPNNMFIWATMNSADQGVFPIDTAFKRRWEFEYIGVDVEEEKVEKYIIPIGDSEHRKHVKWNDLRKRINNILVSDDCKVNEDKLLGPFFVSKNVLETACENEERFVRSFESKVIMYLFEDAMKMRPANIFRGHKGRMIFSEICKTFEEQGAGLFGIEDIDYVEQ